jgi:hypothetical protein
MRLNVKAMAIAWALIWGILVMFLTGTTNLVWPGYGQRFLEMMDSIYPGYKAQPAVGQVIIGTLYGLLDGAVVGALFAWIYNCAARPTSNSPERPSRSSKA